MPEGDSVVVARIIVTASLLLAAFAAPANDLRVIPVSAAMLDGGSEDSSQRKVYIVQLKTPSAAEAFAKTPTSRISKLNAVRGDAPPRFDKHNAVVMNHAQKLQ